MPENPSPEKVSRNQVRDDEGKALKKLVLKGIQDRKPSEVLASSQKLVQIYEDLAAENPGLFRAELASGLLYLGIVFAQIQNLDTGLGFTTRALSIYRSLNEENPKEYPYQLAVALSSYADFLADLKDPVGAFNALDEALGVAVKVDLAPRNGKSFVTLGRLPLLYEEAHRALPNPMDFQLRSDIGMELVGKLVTRFYDEDEELTFKMIVTYVHFSKNKKNPSHVLAFQRQFVAQMRLRTNLSNERGKLLGYIRILANCACDQFLKTREPSLKEEALNSTNEVVRLAREWVSENGSDQARAELDLAGALENVCFTRYRLLGVLPDYLAVLAEAEQLIRKQISIEPVDEALLARILFKKARLPQVPNGLELMQEASAIYTVLSQNDAPTYQAYHLMILNGLSRKYREKKLWKNGLAVCETALSILEGETPQRADWLLNKAGFQKKLSFHDKAAVECVSEHIRIYRQLFNQDRARYIKQMADALREGASQLFLVDNKRAYEWVEEGISLLKELCSQDVASTNAVASALLTQSNIAVQLQDHEAALRTGRECIQLLDDFGSEADPDILARALYSLGRKKIEGKSVEESTAMQRRSLEIRERLVQETSGRAKESHLMDLARTLESLGDVLRFAGQIDEARTTEQAEVAAREALVPFDRKRHYPEVASALEYQFNKNPEHVHLLERAISIYRETSAEALHERGPNCLSRCLDSLAEFRLAKGEVELAAEAAKESVELIRTFQERLPSELLDGLLALAKVQAAQAKWEYMAASLRESFQECLRIDNPISKKREFIEIEPKATALIAALPIEQAALAASLTAELESMGYLKERVVFPKRATAQELD